MAKVQTSMTYEELARRLGLSHGLRIELVEVNRMSGRVSLIVTGDLPPRTVTRSGFYPSQPFSGAEPDGVNIHHLIDPS